MTTVSSDDLPGEKKASIRDELETVRNRQEALAEQLVQLQDLLQTSQRALGLTEEHFRGTLSRSLEFLRAEPLQPFSGGTKDSKAVVRWKFPEMDRRPGADPTWADTLDTLKPPR
jgi:hypothetical protein